jgi:excisionase family DNA binding protein
MSQPSQNPFDLLLDQIRLIVRQEINAALANGAQQAAENDRSLTVEEAADRLGVSVNWLYRHAKKLPFSERISRKNLRFSEAGLRKWLATKKP